jgi:hypothetical protein
MTKASPVSIRPARKGDVPAIIALLVELLTHHTRVDAQRFCERPGLARSHVGMTIRF